MSLYQTMRGRLTEHGDKPLPPNLRTSDKCCIACDHCDDETLTLCLKYSFVVQWHELCDDFKRSELHEHV
jgi:hypothetical protein